MKTAINNCLRNWYDPWKKSFLDGRREFEYVYGLMDNLLQYEDQITNSDTVLSNDRVNGIARAVARLIDCGNAVLNIDLIIRNNDETTSEMDPTTVTTIKLFQAHLEAHKLREKLLYDYFKKDKPSLIVDESPSLTTSLSLTVNNLQVGSSLSSQTLQPSPTLHRSLIGSSTSVNTASEGRRTPQPSSATQIEVKLNHTDLNNDLGQLEITHMTATIKSSVFSASSSSATRLTLLPGILAKIESLLSMPTSAEKISNCFEILDALLDSIERLPDDNRHQEVHMITTALLKLIVRKVYIDDRDKVVEFQHAHWTTCLLSMIRLMSATDFNSYLKHFNNMADLKAFIKDYLFIVKRIVSSPGNRQASSNSLEFDIIDSPGPTYPDCWIEMIFLAASTFLTSLTYLYQVLRKYFASNLQMWLSFIDCLIHFIQQDALKSDRQVLKERQRLFADDLRQTSAEYVWISWDSLSIDQKQQILEDLIEPLLRSCMTLHSRQRSVLLPIFYDMMRCDYTSQYITPRGSLCGSNSSTLRSQKNVSIDYTMYEDDLESLPPINVSKLSTPTRTNESLPYLSLRDNKSEDGTVLTKFTHLIIGKLNILMIDLELGDKYFKNELCAALSGELNPRYYNRDLHLSSNDCDQFKSMARHTSDLIAEFMQICLDSRQSNKLDYKHLQLLCIFRLILFFRDKVDRIELYLSNLYRLCYLHHAAGRFVEAGYTLLEHAKALPWSNDQLDSHYRQVTRFFHVPQPLTDFMSLKIFLYNTIMEYFDQGQLWEAAVPLCRELIDVYEFKTYEYNKLAYILQKRSSYFRKIVEDGSRSNPEYFRVTFYGRGFPECLREITVVYRGRAFEKLGDFQATMLIKYPDAKLLTSLAKPDESLLMDPDARYLQINACSPSVDLRSRFGPNSPKIEESILNYYRHNECDKFHFSRRISAPQRKLSESTSSGSSDDNFANMWRERTTLTTNTLPGMLPFFPVYLMETSIVSPIESAIEDLERTNDRLSCMVNRFKADKRQTEDARLLGQLLLGIVDAAVNGGITKYEEAFFNSNSDGGGADSSNSTSSAGRGGHSNDITVAPSSTGNGCTGVPINSTMNDLESNFGGLYVTLDQAGGLPKQQQTSGRVNHQSLIDHGGPKRASTTNNGRASMGTDVVDGTSSVGKVDKLKSLIAQQVPLLDEAIQLHRNRVADVMRPQHEHLELSYKKLKHHVMSKYSRYLPADYSRSSMRSFRSMARSPNCSIRSDSRLPLTIMTGESGRFSSKRFSDASVKRDRLIESSSSFQQQISPAISVGSPPADSSSSSIPYRQFGSERRSLPFLTGVNPNADASRELLDMSTLRRLPSPPSSLDSPQEGLEIRPVMVDDLDNEMAPTPTVRTLIGQPKPPNDRPQQLANDTYVDCSSMRIQFKQSYTRLMGNSIERQEKLLSSSESRDSLELDEEDGGEGRTKSSSDNDEVNLVSL